MTKEERVRVLRKELGLTQEEFAERIHVKRGVISSIEINRGNLTERMANDICDVYNVNYQWLVDGEDVPMFFDDQTMLDEVAREYGLNKNERILIEYYLNNPDKREAIVKEIYALAERMDNKKSE